MRKTVLLLGVLLVSALGPVYSADVPKTSSIVIDTSVSHGNQGDAIEKVLKSLNQAVTCGVQIKNKESGDDFRDAFVVCLKEVASGFNVIGEENLVKIVRGRADGFTGDFNPELLPIKRQTILQDVIFRIITSMLIEDFLPAIKEQRGGGIRYDFCLLVESLRHRIFDQMAIIRLIHEKYEAIGTYEVGSGEYYAAAMAYQEVLLIYRKTRVGMEGGNVLSSFSHLALVAEDKLRALEGDPSRNGKQAYCEALTAVWNKFFDTASSDKWHGHTRADNPYRPELWY